MRHALKTVCAYRWMLRFDAVYQLVDPDDAADYLRRFTRGARDSRVAPIVRFAQMIDEYWLGIVNWWHSRISNGLLEALHSVVQAAKRRARGYRSTRNYIPMIHLTACKLDVPVTQLTYRAAQNQVSSCLSACNTSPWSASVTFGLSGRLIVRSEIDDATGNCSAARLYLSR
jgi:hypothetical protein